MDQEKKIRVVSKETLNKVIRCFADVNELEDFRMALNTLCYQIAASSQLGVKSQDEAIVLALRQIAHFTYFCQENIEVIRELMQVCAVEELTASELEQMNQSE